MVRVDKGARGYGGREDGMQAGVVREKACCVLLLRVDRADIVT